MGDAEDDDIAATQAELTDPAGQPLEVVRDVRDDIARRVEALLGELATIEEVTS